MKNITINPNSKIAKTAKFTFHSLHLIMIAVVLLFFSVESHAQSAARHALAVQQQEVNTPAPEQSIISNPAVNVVTYNAYCRSKQVTVNSSKIIRSIVIYDLSGRVLFSVNGVNSRDYKTPSIDVPNQIVVVKSLFENDSTASRNIVLN